jgi:hypothetical protein
MGGKSDAAFVEFVATKGLAALAGNPPSTNGLSALPIVFIRYGFPVSLGALLAPD